VYGAASTKCPTQRIHSVGPWAMPSMKSCPHGDALPHRRADRVGGRISEIFHSDERLGRDELEGDLGEDAEGAVGAVDHFEREGLSIGGHAQDLARRRHDLVREAAIVKAPVAVGHRLHGAPGDRAADGDAAQLGHDGGHQPVGQRRSDERLERDAGLDDTAARLGIDRQHAAERGDVDGPPAKAAVAGQRDEVVDAALVDVDRRLLSRELGELGGDGANPFVVIGAELRRHRLGSHHGSSTRSILVSSRRTAARGPSAGR
jgi:hypothetical protein